VEFDQYPFHAFKIAFETGKLADTGGLCKTIKVRNRTQNVLIDYLIAGLFDRILAFCRQPYFGSPIHPSPFHWALNFVYDPAHLPVFFII